MKRRSLYLSTIDPQAPELAREWGFGLEIAEFCTAWNLDQEFPQVDPKVRQALSGVSHAVLHGPFNELFPCAIDPKIRDTAAERYRQALETAHGYGISKVILHAGFNPYLYYPCWFTQQSIPFWKEFLPQIPEGMTICLENVLEEEPQMLLDILHSVDDPRLRMCLDVGHAQAYSKKSPMDWLTDCQDVLDHFHVHNNNGSKDLHADLFDGVIPMVPLLNQIQMLCPQATVTLELPNGKPSLDWMEEHHLLEDLL